ncbi:MAG: transglycosylase domain-containing protein [Proteobacteria bacterium]|nr:transglycosylase domain-containing protein [Pseudomonadota bacterium]
MDRSKAWEALGSKLGAFKVNRKAVVAAVVFALVTLGMLLTVWWVPATLRSWAESELSDRLGTRVAIEDVSVGTSTLVITGISAGPDTSPSLRLATLRVQGSLLAALTQGSRAFHTVSVSGVQLRLQADRSKDALFNKLVTIMHGRRKTVHRGPKRSGVLVWSVRDLTIHLEDAWGLLVRAQVPQASGTAQLASIRLKRIGLGSEPSGNAQLSDVVLQIRRERGRVKLHEAKLGAAQIMLPTGVALAANDPKIGPLNGSPQGNGASSGAHEPRAAAGFGLAQRLAALRRALTGSKSAPDDAPRTAPSGESDLRDNALSRLLLARLTPSGSIFWRQVNVRRRLPDGGTEPALSSLEGRLERRGRGAFHVLASGQTSDGGEASCDMRVWPQQLRAEGTIDLQALSLSLLAPLLPSVPWHEPDTCRVDAQLVIEAQSVKRLALRGRVRVSNAGLASPRLAKEPIQGISFELSGQGSWLPAERRLEIERGLLVTGRAAFELQGIMEWAADHYFFDFGGKLGATPCTDAVRSIPADLLGELVDFSWGGTLAAETSLHVDSRTLDETSLTFNFEDDCEFASAPAMADLQRFGMPFVHTVVEPDDTLFAFETGPGTEAWIPIEEISPYLIHAVLAHEDLRFFKHAGFAPNQIRNALVKNLKAGAYRVGASTITMQLVKNLLLRREKTLRRKVQEAVLTWWVERMLEKKDILELYLNVIEYGPAVYGVRNAARHYFSRLPQDLSPAEAVYLANILPNPKLYYEHFTSGKLPPAFIAKLIRMMKRMGERGWYSVPATEYGLRELESFGFHPDEGVLLPARVVPGGASPLPYEPDAELWEKMSWAWSDSAAPTEGESDPGLVR